MRLLVHSIWEELGKIPCNTDDYTEERFLHFPIGTHKFDIWHWIENKYNYPIAKLLYPK